MNNNEGVFRTHCNECLKTTNNIILFSKRNTWINDYYPEDSPSYNEHKDYLAVQCLGCDEISFLIRHSGGVFATEHDAQGYFDENFPSSEYDNEFPLLNEDEQNSLPRLLQDLYEEVEGAFIEESSILAGVGLRILVEAICINQSIGGNNLQEKIRNLSSEGLISKNELPILDKLRLIGNFSAHEIKSFPLDKLVYALEIVNHVLKSIYVLPKIDKKLKI